jgi:putative Ca2+/H+ antiporter (TMEM165/GDT1 family)
LAAKVDPNALRWSLATTFLLFAVWILVPDKEEEIRAGQRWGALLTTVVAFFIAEMGDKTQLATIALGARYAETTLVTVGTTMGMMGSNALAIFLGERLLKRVPMKWVRWFASALFVLFGLVILIVGV